MAGLSGVLCFCLLTETKSKSKGRPRTKPKSCCKDHEVTPQTFKLNGTAIDDDELMNFAHTQWQDNRSEIKAVLTVYHARHLLRELGYEVERNTPCDCGHKH